MTYANGSRAFVNSYSALQAEAEAAVKLSVFGTLLSKRRLVRWRKIGFVAGEFLLHFVSAVHANGEAPKPKIVNEHRF